MNFKIKSTMGKKSRWSIIDKEEDLKRKRSYKYPRYPLFSRLWKEIKKKKISVIVRVAYFFVRLLDRDGTIQNECESIRKIHQGMIVDIGSYHHGESVSKGFIHWFRSFLPEELAKMRKQKNIDEALKTFWKWLDYDEARLSKSHSVKEQELEWKDY